MWGAAGGVGVWALWALWVLRVLWVCQCVLECAWAGRGSGTLTWEVARCSHTKHLLVGTFLVWVFRARGRVVRGGLAWSVRYCNKFEV